VNRAEGFPVGEMALIRHHIRLFKLGPGGRLLVGERDKNELPILTINRIWRQARKAAFTEEVAASPLTETRMTCDTRQSRHGSTRASPRPRSPSGPDSRRRCCGSTTPSASMGDRPSCAAGWRPATAPSGSRPGFGTSSVRTTVEGR
jgi:hypothetical protein